MNSWKNSTNAVGINEQLTSVDRLATGLDSTKSEKTLSQTLQWQVVAVLKN
jgi:hypothetical protein